MADPETVPPELDSILSGDSTVVLAQVTPLRGVVPTPVNPFGWDSRTRTITVTSTLAGFKKLQRLQRNPRVAVAFHTREHGTGRGEGYVLVQGEAEFSWTPDRTELADLLDRPGHTLGPATLGGPVWNRWLAPFWWDRVVIRIRAERIVAFPDPECLGTPVVFGAEIRDEPPAPQSPPANGIAPRSDVRRAARRLRRLPHRLLGWVGSDGFPVVVPVRVHGHDSGGIAVSAPAGLLPAGGRRAGLLGHWFSSGSLGTRQLVMTGWLTAGTAGSAVYAPHTMLGYSMPPSRLVFRLVMGAVTRVGNARARRSGVRVPARSHRWRTTVTGFQRRIANPVARRVSRYLPGQAVLETVGRHSGLPRRTPIGGRLDGDTFWLVTEFGRQSHYVRNLEVNPRVRLQVGGAWRSGTAVILDEDDVRRRLRLLPWLNSTLVRLVGNEFLTVRIDLDRS